MNHRPLREWRPEQLLALVWELILMDDTRISGFVSAIHRGLDDGVRLELTSEPLPRAGVPAMGHLLTRGGTRLMAWDLGNQACLSEGSTFTTELEL